MATPLQRILAREQGSFLARNRNGWAEHLLRVRDFLGEGLDRAQPGRTTLVLGAGSGLEVPWGRAPRGAVGWDGDPFSRLRTLARHRRWIPWVFGDITGAFAPLWSAAQRSVQETWSHHRRSRDVARLRLAALLPSLGVDPAPLANWIATHRPGTILGANFMGQLGPLAQRVVENAFAPVDPWDSSADEPDDLAVALDQWTARVVRCLLRLLVESGADLWLVHDRAVMGAEGGLVLGPFQPDWKRQIQGTGKLEVVDPLAGVDVVAALGGRAALRRERWLWALGPDQIHLVEALAVQGGIGDRDQLR